MRIDMLGMDKSYISTRHIVSQMCAFSVEYLLDIGRSFWGAGLFTALQKSGFSCVF